jgi:hypothetical protein
MPRLRNTAVTVRSVLACVIAVSCQGPTGPTSHIGTVEQLAQSLRQQGFAVSIDGEIAPKRMGFFSVPARQLSVDRERLSAFEYPTAERAAADAALLSPDAQPNPRARVTWVSTPRFYRGGRLIVLYVGCASDVVTALEIALGPPVATGPTPCR